MVSQVSRLNISRRRIPLYKSSKILEREEQCNIVLDRLMTIEKELQSDRNAMQTTIDAKQRLIDQQV